MTASTAYDTCTAELAKAHRCLANAKKLGNQTMVARFERRVMRCERALAEWGQHSALRCVIRPESGRFVSRAEDGRYIGSSSSLYGAQLKSVERGRRQVCISRECGVFA